MKTLTLRQTAAVNSTAERILCIAGAGSGKTTTMIERINRLIDAGVSPGTIVAITFTNAAANEIRGRMRKGVKLGFVGTLHGFCALLLRERGDKVGVWENFTVIDEDQRDALLQRLATAHKCRASFKEIVRTLKTAYDALAAHGRYAATDKVSLVVRAYIQSLQDSNALDFDLLLVKTIQLFKAHTINGDFRFTHLFVDEYQDSADYDAELYELLPFTHRFFVGDTDQAIYSFRGGNVENILALANGSGYRAQPSDVIVLEENFRCGEAICVAAQQLIEHNGARYPKKTISASPESGHVDVWSHSDPDSELRAIARHIKDSGCQNDCAVLFATNDLCRKATEVFEKDFGIEIKAKGLGDVPRDFSIARSIMAFAINPESDLLARRVLEMRFDVLGADSIALDAALRMKSINAHALQETQSRTIGEMFAMLERNKVSAESQQKLKEIVAKLPSEALPADLVIAATRDMYHRDELGTGCVVTTFHSAKGREWGTVFLGACEQAVIPSERASLNIEEARRLFYVGMTRAKRELILSHARTRAAFGQRRCELTAPSQFLAECGFKSQ
jgi:DNA helicase-2/ATP-dependent DNA helicase PcrA